VATAQSTGHVLPHIFIRKKPFGMLSRTQNWDDAQRWKRFFRLGGGSHHGSRWLSQIEEAALAFALVLIGPNCRQSGTTFPLELKARFVGSELEAETVTKGRKVSEIDGIGRYADASICRRYVWSSTIRMTKQDIGRSQRGQESRFAGIVGTDQIRAFSKGNAEVLEGSEIY
jgi:hypothetical protein